MSERHCPIITTWCNIQNYIIPHILRLRYVWWDICLGEGEFTYRHDWRYLPRHLFENEGDAWGVVSKRRGPNSIIDQLFQLCSGPSRTNVMCGYMAGKEKHDVIKMGWGYMWGRVTFQILLDPVKSFITLPERSIMKKCIFLKNVIFEYVIVGILLMLNMFSLFLSLTFCNMHFLTIYLKLSIYIMLFPDLSYEHFYYWIPEICILNIHRLLMAHISPICVLSCFIDIFGNTEQI